MNVLLTSAKRCPEHSGGKMKNEIIIALHKNFEEYAHQVDG